MSPSLLLSSRVSAGSGEAAKRRSLRRARAGGAVMFIIAMTVAVITAMGVYALSIASTEVRTAGFIRQQVATQYLSQYGAQAAAQAVSGTNAQMYDTLIMSPTQRDTNCVSLFGVPATASNQALACHRAGSAELAIEIATTSGNPLLVPWTSNATALSRGSVGLPVSADFFVEVTDPNQRQPPPGYAVNSSLCFVQFTASAYGLTPTTGLSTATQGFQSEGFEMSRARIVGGPVTCSGTN